MMASKQTLKPGDVVELSLPRFYKIKPFAEKVKSNLHLILITLLLLFILFKPDTEKFAENVEKSVMGEVLTKTKNTEVEMKAEVKQEPLISIFKSKDYFEDKAGDDSETKATKRYIRKFKNLAVEESKRYGVPASVKMAQAILETNSGRSELARKNNNHFGVKCFSRTCSKGHCSNFGDDSHKDFFRKYDSAWESWRAHSKMLISGKYKVLLKHGNDYEAWAKGFKELGYATANHYDKTLVGIVEKYHLQSLD